MKKPLCVLLILLLLAVASLLLLPMAGMKFIPLWSEGKELDILLLFRFPRVFCAFIAGAMLSLSGLAFQTLFRNALATPFTLGVSSGATLGIALFIRLGLVFSLPGFSSLSIAAFCGSLLAVGLVYGLTRLKSCFSITTLLLAGIAVNFFFSSLVLLIQDFSDPAESFRMVKWMMGSLASADYPRLFNLLPFLAVGGTVMLLLHREMNLLMVGEDLALTRGVPTGRIKKLLFFSTSLMVAGVVANFGPIGFVGMMSPHICRLLIGADHRWLTPAALLFGGAFLAVCDTFAHSLPSGAEIPVGIITALLGGPFFIWLLLSRR
ncbi:MAG: iron ABC transporter permease [Lentisphaerae bacterium]|jgi:iron complex transport system permease protein|nr:iron ABC transporter permease [Lentisphaerota bacterium]